VTALQVHPYKEHDVKVTFAHVCEFATTNRDGNLSIFNIFRQITATALPLTIPQMAIAWEWAMSYAEVNLKHTFNVELVDQDGNKVITMGGEVIAKPAPGHQPKPGETAYSSQVVNLQRVEFKKPGHYDLNFFVAGQLVHSTTFTVVVAQAKAA
jgi:hypothetical protein